MCLQLVLCDVVGDVGGFMGLLLGGSVLTVFELLDLVIFNFVKKLIAQGKLPDPEEKKKKHKEKVRVYNVNTY